MNSRTLIGLSKLELTHRLDLAQERTSLVYTERNKVVALAAELALACGLNAGVGRDWEADDGWQHVIYIDLPSGQVSWHIPDDELSFVRRLPMYRKPWDSHDDTVKYYRVLNPGLSISHTNDDDEGEKTQKVEEIHE